MKSLQEIRKIREEKRKELLTPKWKKVNELEKNDLIGTPVNNKEILPDVKIYTKSAEGINGFIYLVH